MEDEILYRVDRLRDKLQDAMWELEDTLRPNLTKHIKKLAALDRPNADLAWEIVILVEEWEEGFWWSSLLHLAEQLDTLYGHLVNKKEG
jgi:hypothetical protein